MVKNGMPLVITGVGVVACNAFTTQDFWQAQYRNQSLLGPLTIFSNKGLDIELAGEISGFDYKAVLGQTGLRNLDRSSLFVLAAAKQAKDNAGLEITETNTDDYGVCTGTTFSHIAPIVDFDRDVFLSGIGFANPALFPNTVLNAASSQVSIRFNIQGFNTTISTGYTSGLQALDYSVNALNTNKAKTVFCCAVETLSEPLLWGFKQMKYLAGIKGIAQSCPFDLRRNGPVLAEAAVALTLESQDQACQRKAKPIAWVRGISCGYNLSRRKEVKDQAFALTISQALTQADKNINEIDYISSSANSSVEVDQGEVAALFKVFGKKLADIPVSSIKSIFGETVSASAGLQIASCLGAMINNKIPATVNYQQKDPQCGIDCVANQARKRFVQNALVICSGPGGYHGACVLERYYQ